MQHTLLFASGDWPEAQRVKSRRAARCFIRVCLPRTLWLRTGSDRSHRWSISSEQQLTAAGHDQNQVCNLCKCYVLPTPGESYLPQCLPRKICSACPAQNSTGGLLNCCVEDFSAGQRHEGCHDHAWRQWDLLFWAPALSQCPSAEAPFLLESAAISSIRVM